MRRLVIAALLCSVTACSTQGDNEGTEPPPSQVDAQKSPGDTQGGTTGQGKGSSGTQQSRDGAQSAADQIASGEGLLVKNQTGDTITLIFRDGDTAAVNADKSVTVLRVCRDLLPLRVENKSGEVIAEYNGPCRTRDTWTVK